MPSSVVTQAPDWSARKLHFVGIGGAGMSGLALIARKLGAQVSGSDRSETRYLPELRELGIEPLIGHRAENVPAGAEVVYSTAIVADNPERVIAREPGGGGELHRAQLLAQLTQCKRCLAVAGTHGKTTTTGMVVAALRGAGMDPAYVVGGELAQTGRNADWGTGEWIVVEADESDRSLLRLKPELAILTNAELDHHATYGSRLEVEQTFAEFLDGVDTAVVWSQPDLLALATGANRVVPYSPGAVDLGDGHPTFTWQVPDGAGQAGAEIEVRLAVPGLHNATNAAGALCAAALAGADPAAAVAAIGEFHGAHRRLEPLGYSAAGAALYDDYAHHPTEVAATLAAARTLTDKRLIAVFQPHLFSRTRALAGDFGRALASADACAVLDIYPAREQASDFPGVDGRLVAAAAADANGGRAVAWTPTQADAQRWLADELRDGDVCVLMGAGDIDELGRSLAAGGRAGA